MKNTKIISAGAGSGKTYRLTKEMVQYLVEGKVRPEGIIATTFTRKAAAELQERARMRLLEDGLTREADALGHAIIGTVHGMGVKLLHRFAYEAGVSPKVDIIPDEDHQMLFNQSLAIVLTGSRVSRIEELVQRFGEDPGNADWRKQVRQITELARANAFGFENLEDSRIRSWESMLAFLDPIRTESAEEFNRQLDKHLSDTIVLLEDNEDKTKATATVVDSLSRIQRQLKLHKNIPWPDWARMGKLKPGAKSRDDVADLVEFARGHLGHPDFHQDIKEYIDILFGLAADAIREYDNYKKSRGLIDYTDMEVLVDNLLGKEPVKAVLREELDLLMVDEFQDTSPLQLEIFLKLSRLAKHSVWVGDPKQSIYGFRGAEPELMQAVIKNLGGVNAEDIQTTSWRSRPDIVHATNAVFSKAFTNLPTEQIVLKPREDLSENPKQAKALKHWKIRYTEAGRKPAKVWTNRAIAEGIRLTLEAGKTMVIPKGSVTPRLLQPGDMAILCRSNNECRVMAEKLAEAGIKAAISRAGLLLTAEAKLILACLKYLLNRRDSLSVAEILILGNAWTTGEMVEDRLDYLEGEKESPWAFDTSIIKRLDELRKDLSELSSSEMLDVVLEDLDLRRTVVAWGNAEQRLDNVECLRRMALEYESATSRMHSASSLGGYLLWLAEQAADEKDKRGSGEAPDAVNVLTYHASKGLEWPMVICHSLDNALRGDLWGLAIVAEQDEVDLDAVLAHRWIRYWVNPYGRSSKDTPLDDRLSESPVAEVKLEEARQEETRLLYVGITRARDYLVLAEGLSGTPWLNRVFHGDDKHATLPGSEGESPWEWEGKKIPLEINELGFGLEFPIILPPAETIMYWEDRKGQVKFPTQFIEPKNEGAPVTLGPLESVRYEAPFPPTDIGGTRELGQMLKAYFAAVDPRSLGEDQKLMAQGHLLRFLPDDNIEPVVLVDYAASFFQKMASQYPGRSMRRHYPVKGYFDGRMFEAVADILLEGEEDIVVVQNSAFEGTASDCKKHAKSLAPWMGYLCLALEQVFGKPVSKAAVNFLLEGQIVEGRPARQAIPS